VDDEIADHESTRLVSALQQASNDSQHVYETALAIRMRPRKELADVLAYDERQK
jgi:hypothetical protein